MNLVFSLEISDQLPLSMYMQVETQGWFDVFL